MDTMSKPLIPWIRVSTMEQAGGTSPINQREKIEKYAAGCEIPLTPFHLDLSGVSGKSVMETKEFRVAVEKIKSGEAGGIIAVKLSRLGRNARELLEILDFCEKNNARLVFVEERFDTNTAWGRFFYTLASAFAEMERRETVSRVSGSVKHKADNGESLGGIAPFGYKWDTQGKHKKLIINRDEASLVEFAFDEFNRQQNISRTLKSFNDRYSLRERKIHVGKMSSRKLNGTTLKRWIRFGPHHGFHMRNYCKSKGNKKSWKFKDMTEQSSYKYVPVEPIISLDVWKKANDILDNIYRRNGAPVKRLLSGKILCGKCGRKLYPFFQKSRSGIPKYRCLKCGSSISHFDFENSFKAALSNIRISPAKLVPLLQLEDAETIKLQSDITRLENKLAEIEFQKTNLINAQSRDLNLVPHLSSKLKTLEKEKNGIEATIKTHAEQLALLPKQQSNHNQLVSKIDNLLTEYGSLTEQQRTKLADLIVHKVVVSDARIEFVFHDNEFLTNSLLPEKSINDVLKSHQTDMGSSQPRA